MVLVPVALREVIHEHYVPDPKRPRQLVLMKTTRGTEIVKETPFCPSCAQNAIAKAPAVVNPGDPAIRTHVVIKRNGGLDRG